MQDATYTVPDHLRVLGTEARLLHRQVLAGLDARPLPEPTPDGSLLDLAPTLLRRMSDELERLQGLLNGPFNDAAAGDRVDAVYRVMGRAGQLLDQLLTILHEARSIAEEPSESYPKVLLCDAMADILAQIGTFFDHVADAIDDPGAYVDAGDIGPGGTVVLPLSLVLDVPPELHELEGHWRRIASTAGAAAPRRGGIDLLALSLAILLGSSLFGRCD